MKKHKLNKVLKDLFLHVINNPCHHIYYNQHNENIEYDEVHLHLSSFFKETPYHCGGEEGAIKAFAELEWENIDSGVATWTIKGRGAYYKVNGEFSCSYSAYEGDSDYIYSEEVAELSQEEIKDTLSSLIDFAASPQKRKDSSVSTGFKYETNLVNGRRQRLPKR